MTPTDEGVPPSMTIWLDPGKTTGWAYLTENYSFHSGQLDFMQLGSQLEMSCSIHGSALWLGWEDFIITPRTAAMHGSEFALEVIGMTRYIAQKYECTLLPPCSPSGRELGSLQKLRRLGWYTPGKPHANDAAQHLLAYALRDHLLPDDLLSKALAGDTGAHATRRPLDIETG